MSTMLKAVDQKPHQPRGAKGTTEQLVVKIEHTKGKRTRQIRITEDLYQELARLGDLTNDWQDVVAFLWKFYKDRQPQQGKQ